MTASDARPPSDTGTLVGLRLVPVGVFGADDGYGLGDEVPAWSDCNRAWGRTYRVDDDLLGADEHLDRVQRFSNHAASRASAGSTVIFVGRSSVCSGSGLAVADLETIARALEGHEIYGGGHYCDCGPQAGDGTREPLDCWPAEHLAAAVIAALAGQGQP